MCLQAPAAGSLFVKLYGGVASAPSAGTSSMTWETSQVQHLVALASSLGGSSKWSIYLHSLDTWKVHCTRFSVNTCMVLHCTCIDMWHDLDCDIVGVVWECDMGKCMLWSVTWTSGVRVWHGQVAWECNLSKSRTWESRVILIDI